VNRRGANNIATSLEHWMERMSQPKPRRKRQSKSTPAKSTPAKSTPAKSTPAKSTAPAKIAEFSEQERRDAAYYLWEQEGRPEGRALDHWLQVAGQRSDDMTVVR
jgi:hypothetical protein